MRELPGTIETVRAFTRFYTAIMGTLNEGLLQSSLTLAEARVLFEIANSEKLTATEVSSKLKLDLGYVSRILARFDERGLIRRNVSAMDARQNEISLTTTGRKQFDAVDRRSNEEVAQLLSGLAPAELQKLAHSMRSIEMLLQPGKKRSSSTQPFVLRSHHPGDMGWIIHRHGALYAQEYGWDQRFEALVAKIAADFIEQYDPRCERCWIAEQEGAFAGCVFLVKDRTAEKTAKLRLLLVEPSARGAGLGRTLVRQCTEFARLAGYSRIVLWTNSLLTSARRIYEGEGYRLRQEEEHKSFGKKLTGQNWELLLTTSA